MVRLVLKLVSLFLLLGLIAAASLCVRVLGWRSDSERVHTVTNGVDYVFLGPSHMGCAVVEAPEFRNRVIWQSAQSHAIVLMRLLELERLGQLDKVKGVVIEPFSSDLGTYEHDIQVNATLHTLPFSWRYFRDVTDIGYFDILKNLFLKPQQDFGVLENPPDTEKPFSNRSVDEQLYHAKKSCKAHYGWIGDTDLQWKDIEKTVGELLVRIKDVCARNKIDLYFVSLPVTSMYVSQMPDRAKRFDKFIAAKVKELEIRTLSTPVVADYALFLDSHHLNRNGAKWFTTELYRLNGL